MGLFDKVKDLAQSAKGELDRTGLLDHLSTDASIARSDGQEPAGAWDATSEMVQVIRCGGLDPRTLITADEIAAIAGHAVAPRRPNGPYQGEGLVFEAYEVYFEVAGGGEMHALSVFHTDDDSHPWDPDATYDEISWSDPDSTETIAGLGDRACAVGNRVYVQQSGRVLAADVTGDRVDGARARQQAVEVLRCVITRL